jgi:hypothetical protein
LTTAIYSDMVKQLNGILAFYPQYYAFIEQKFSSKGADFLRSRDRTIEVIK